MKHTHLIILASLFWSLCSSQAQTNSPGRSITGFGDVSFPQSPWTVQVSETNRTVKISYRYLSGTNGISSLSFTSPKDWRAKSGWFVFIENNERVWAYDGGSNLFLQVCIPYKVKPRCVSYGPSYFPYTVPTIVFARLSKKTQDAIKDDISE
ncbi:MAG TPA: hypothetical protein VGO57_14670 [Verrucomicrobiae bacterium]